MNKSRKPRKSYRGIWGAVILIIIAITVFFWTDILARVFQDLADFISYLLDLIVKEVE